MALDNFSRIDMKINKANDYYIDTQFAKEGDYNGRELVVQITNAGDIESQRGVSLNLGWRHNVIGNSGLTPFEDEDASKGIFKIIYPNEMLNAGNVTAFIQIIESGKVINTRDFTIEVEHNTLNARAIVLDDSFETLNKALTTVNQYDNRIANLELGKADKSNAVTQSEFDSWVATLLDGGPSIFMNTLSELKATYPNGAAGVALVRETDPAKIYVWNGSAWEDFGDYQGIELKDGTVTTAKLAESFWASLKLQDIFKSLENDFKQNNLLSFSPAGYQDSSSNATIGEDGEIIILANGHYFVTKSVGGDVKVGDTISAALKMTKATTAVQLGLEFRNGEDSISITNLNYAGNGWYVLEGVTVPTNTTSIRLRVDNRQSSYASKFNYYTLQKGANLRATLLVDKQIEDLKNQLPSLSTYPIEVPYEYPTGFKWTNNPLAYVITTNGKGGFYTDFDVAKFKVTGKAYYVDPVNGDDTNLGSSVAPFKSINVALNQPDIKELHLMEGIYSRDFSMSKATHTGDLSIIGHGDVHISSNSNSVLSKSASYSNVYEVTRGAIHNYAVDTSVNNGGLPLVMVEVNSIEEVNATKNSYYHDGTKLYIRTYDDRDVTGLSLDHGLILSSGMSNTIFEGNMDLYLENVTIYGSTSPLQARSTSSSDVLRVFGKNSNFLISGDENKDAVMLQGTTLSIFQNCKAGYSLKDGFNYHAKDGIIPKSIEINCQGFENGNDTDDNDQGSTTHDGGSIIRIGGAYYRNKGANIAEDATGNTGTESLNLGVVGFESNAPSENREVNFDCYDGVKMWLDGCTGYGSLYDISQKGENGQLKIRNSNLSTLNQPEGQRVVEMY